MKQPMKLSDCCWADYMLTESEKTSCYACGCECKIVNVTQKMIDFVEECRNIAIKSGYLEEE